MWRFFAFNSKFRQLGGLLFIGLLISTAPSSYASESEALSDEVESSDQPVKPELHAAPAQAHPLKNTAAKITPKIESQEPVIETELPQAQPMAEKLELPEPLPDRSLEETQALQNSQTSDAAEAATSVIDEETPEDAPVAQPKTSTKENLAPSASKVPINEKNEKIANEKAVSEKTQASEPVKVEDKAQEPAPESKVTEQDSAEPEKPVPTETEETKPAEKTKPVAAPVPQMTETVPQEAEVKKDDTPRSFTLLGTEIPPGMATRVAWRPGHTLKGLASQAPVLVVNGAKPGPTLCITGAVHGDELNGIEIVRQVLHFVKAPKLKGALIGVPIVNVQGFLRNSRYLVDRRDLNRFFPGTPHGSLASRIAHSFFNQVIMNCSALVDVHTGSFYRDNIPQLRADLRIPSVLDMTEGFGSTLVLQSAGAGGTLRKAATNIGIPSVTLELGGPMILDEDAVENGVEGILNLMDALGMYKKHSFWGTPKPVYYQSLWVRAEHGGIFFSKVKLGDQIEPGDLLGTITNPITNEQFLLTSPYKGEVVGLANNQVVYPGFATTHLAFKTEAPQPDKLAESPETLERD